MISYGCFCSRYIESLRLGQLQLVNCDVILTPQASCQTNVFFIEWLRRECFSLNDCEGKVSRLVRRKRIVVRHKSPRRPAKRDAFSLYKIFVRSCSSPTNHSHEPPLFKSYPNFESPLRMNATEFNSPVAHWRFYKILVQRKSQPLTS